MSNLVEFLQGFIGMELGAGKDNRLAKIAAAGYIEEGNAVPIAQDVNIAGKNANLWVSFRGEILVNFGNELVKGQYISCSKNGIVNHPPKGDKFTVNGEEFDPRGITLGETASLKKLLNDGIQDELARIEAKRKAPPPPPPPAPQRNLVEFLQGFIQDEVDKGEDDRLDIITEDLEEDQYKPIVQNVVINGINASLWVSYQGEIVVDFGSNGNQKQYIICSRDGIITQEPQANFIVGEKTFDPKTLLPSPDVLRSVLDDGIMTMIQAMKLREHVNLRKGLSPQPGKEVNPNIVFDFDDTLGCHTIMDEKIAPFLFGPGSHNKKGGGQSGTSNFNDRFYKDGGPQTFTIEWLRGQLYIGGTEQSIAMFERICKTLVGDKPLAEATQVSADDVILATIPHLEAVTQSLRAITEAGGTPHLASFNNPHFLNRIAAALEKKSGAKFGKVIGYHGYADRQSENPEAITEAIHCFDRRYKGAEIIEYIGGIEGYAAGGREFTEEQLSSLPPITLIDDSNSVEVDSPIYFIKLDKKGQQIGTQSAIDKIQATNQALLNQLRSREGAPPPPPRPARERNLVEFLQGQLPLSAEEIPSFSAIQELEGWQYYEQLDQFVKELGGHKLYLYPRGTSAREQPCFVIEKLDGNYAFVYHNRIELPSQIPTESQETESQYYNGLTIPQDLAVRIADELAGGIANAQAKLSASVEDSLLTPGLYSEPTRALQEILINEERETYSKLLTALNIYRDKETAQQLHESDVDPLRDACVNYYYKLEQRRGVRDVNDTNETAKLLGRYLTLYSVPDTAYPGEKTTSLLPRIDQLAREVLENWTQVNQEGANPEDLTAARDSIVQIFHPLGNGIEFSAEEGDKQNIAQLQALHQKIRIEAATTIQKGFRAYQNFKNGQVKSEVGTPPPESELQGKVNSEQRRRRQLPPKPPSKRDNPTSVNPDERRDGQPPSSEETDHGGRGDSQPPVPKPRRNLDNPTPSVSEVDPAENAELENAKRENAAIKIQTAFRGHKAKKRLKELKESKEADRRDKILTPGSNENKQVIAYAYVLMTLHRYDHNGKISSKEGLKYFINQAQKLLNVTTPVKGKFPFDCAQLPNDAMIAAAKYDILGQHNRGNKNLKDICKLRDKAQFDKVKEGGVSASELMGIYEEKDKSFNYYLEFAGIDFKGAELNFDKNKLFYANFRGCNFDENSVIAGTRQFLGTAKFTNCSGDQQAFANGHKGASLDKVGAPVLEYVLDREKGDNIANAANRASGLQAGGIFQESFVVEENLSQEFKVAYEADKSNLYNVAAIRIKGLNQTINAISNNKNVVNFMLADERKWEYNSRYQANLDDISGKIARLGIDNGVDRNFINAFAERVVTEIERLISSTPPSRENILVAVKSATATFNQDQKAQLSKIEKGRRGDFNNVIADNIERFVQSAYENIGKSQKYYRIAYDIARQDISVKDLTGHLQDAVREKIEIKKFVAREESILKSQNIEIDQAAQAQYQEAIAEQVTDKPMIKGLLERAQRGEERLLAASDREEQRRSGTALLDQHSVDEEIRLSPGLSTANMGSEPTTDQLRANRSGGYPPNPRDPLLDPTRHDSDQLPGRFSEDRTSLEAEAQAELNRRAVLFEKQERNALLSSIAQSGNLKAVSERASLLAASNAAVKVKNSQPSTTPLVTGQQGKAASRLSDRSTKGAGILGQP